MALWVWIQITHSELINQVLGIEEDKINKPYRPITSGRMSVESAVRVRWILVVIGFIQSKLYCPELLWAATWNLIINVVYNELNGDRCHWAIRQAIIAFGYTPYHYGAALIAGGSVHLIHRSFHKPIHIHHSYSRGKVESG